MIHIEPTRQIAQIAHTGPISHTLLTHSLLTPSFSSSTLSSSDVVSDHTHLDLILRARLLDILLVIAPAYVYFLSVAGH